MQQPRLRIQGGKKLSKGRISIAGSSNQVTKCIIASMLTDEPVLIKSAPDVDERKVVEGLFTFLGGEVRHHESDVIEVCAKTINKWVIPEELCKKKSNRYSLCRTSFDEVRQSFFFWGVGRRSHRQATCQFSC